MNSLLDSDSSSDTPETPASSSSSIKPFEEWAAAKATPVWLLAAAKAVGKWAVGKEVTEADFDATVDRAANASMKAD